MKPIRICIFFATSLLSLAIIAFLMPEKGIGVSGDLRLKFIHFSDLARQETPDQEENVKQLLAKSLVTDDPEADLMAVPKADPEADPEIDAFAGIKNVEVPKVPAIAPANSDSLQNSVFRIQFATGKLKLLDRFFQELDDQKAGIIRRTRILHFGDSQLENDRMTALIRYRLQKHFGGRGTGLVQAIPLYWGSMAYTQDQEGEWLRYTYFGKRDTTILHNSYGIMGAFASVPTAIDGEWPMLHYRFNTSRRSGQCDRIRIFLHSYVDSATVVFQVNDTITDTLKNIPDGFSIVEYQHLGLVKDLEIHLDLPEGGRIYGISFESYTGLQMDNIAMRGGSGLIFSRMDRAQQQTMMNLLSPGLIILQFGGNVVPYMNPGYYRRAFKNELQFYKEICPGVPIVVIGPADMSFREKGVFHTYPGLESIRDALKYATLDSGFAFWDLYEAMGGKNSMPSFVHTEPPLARTDYIHFTNLGINLVAEMFYNALMMEYNKYASEKRNH